MKPVSIFVSILLGLASLGIVVWVGQYQASGLIKPSNASKPAPKAEDLQVPKSGPFGKAEIEETSFDFGKKLVGSTDRHAFSIKNGGEGNLVIKLGKPTCQCTVGEIVKVEGPVVKEGPFPTDKEVSLAPNESVKISVQWAMKAEIEKFRQHVPVFTTDPDRRSIELEITGVVDGAVHLTPAALWDLGELSQTESTKAAGVAYSTILDEFTLAEVPRENSLVKVSWEPADTDFLESKNAKSGYAITVEVDKSVPIGQFREMIRLKIESQKLASEIADEKGPAEGQDAEKKEDAASDSGKLEYNLDFTISGHRSGPIDIRGVVGGGFSTTTNRLVFPDFPAAEGKKIKLTLFPRGMTEDLVLKGVEPADSRFKVTMDQGKVLGNTKSYVVEVTIPPGPSGKHRDDKAETIDLKLNHPDAPDLRLLIDYNAKD